MRTSMLKFYTNINGIVHITGYFNILQNVAKSNIHNKLYYSKNRASKVYI